MGNLDVRWRQRFSSYKKALAQLAKFIQKGTLNELEEQGLIKAFEYTYELGWNLLKDYLTYQGEQNIFGSRDAIRKAFNRALIDDGETWMEMLKARNLTSHAYNQSTANDISAKIAHTFFHAFVRLQDTMQAIEDESQTAQNND